MAGGGPGRPLPDPQEPDATSWGLLPAWWQPSFLGTWLSPASLSTGVEGTEQSGAEHLAVEGTHQWVLAGGGFWEAAGS